MKVVVLAADLSDKHEAERLLAKVSEQAGAVDVLVNNAELGDSVLFDRAKWARTRQILPTNIFAVAQLTAALVPDREYTDTRFADHANIQTPWRYEPGSGRAE